MSFIKTSTLTICCLFACAIGFATPELLQNTQAHKKVEPDLPQNEASHELQNKNSTEKLTNELVNDKPIELGYSGNSSQARQDSSEQDELAELEEALKQARAQFEELKTKHSTLNNTLEEMGEISPRELAEYAGEPFDLLIAGFKAADFEAFEAFFRSVDTSREAANYEELITDYISDHKVKGVDLIHKVDCRRKECKMFLFSSDLDTIFASTSGLRDQTWASDFTPNGYKSYINELDGETETALIYSYFIGDTSGAASND